MPFTRNMITLRFQKTFAATRSLHHESDPEEPILLRSSCLYLPQRNSYSNGSVCSPIPARRFSCYANMSGGVATE